MISFKHVNKIYENGVEAVRDFSLDVLDNEFICLVGASGSGKTTLLRLIAGLSEISSGQITHNGRILNDLPPKARGVAMVFQRYALFPHYTVYQNIAIGARQGYSCRAERDGKIREAASFLGISELLNRKPNTLSGGQRQRVALARAIVKNPKIFLLDEPLSNLDASLRAEMRAEILKIKRRLSTTFIYVTHDQTEAMTMADRIVVMNEGSIQQVGTPSEIYNYPANLYVAGFIGVPKMNILSLESIIEMLGEEAGDSIRKMVGSVEKSSILVGIRAEDIHYKKAIKASKSNANENARGENGVANEGKLAGEGEAGEKARGGWDGATGLEAVIDYIEETGSDSILFCKCLDSSLSVRIKAGHGLKADETITLHFDMTKLHLFDKASGLRLNNLG